MTAGLSRCGAEHGEALALVGLDLRVDAQRLVGLFLVGWVLVDPDDGAVAVVDLLGDPVGGGLDLVLLEALLDRGDRAAPVLDRLDQRAGPRLPRSSVIDSMAYDPANGSTILVTSVS